MSYSRSRIHDQPGHTEDWLITYADTITLLLCFFVVFLIVTIAKKDTAHKIESKASIQKVVRAEAVPKGEIPQLPVPPQPKFPDVFQNDKPFHPLEDTDLVALDANEASAPATLSIVPAVEVAVETPPPEVEVPVPAKIDEPKGDRITTLEINSATFFDKGAANLSDSGKILLGKIANDLKQDQYKDYQITVEGHTDDTPIHTAQFSSNWELSTARAAAVVRFFIEEGLAATKLRAAGYADTFPKLPNHDANGNPLPQNQAQNRRVVIKLEKIEKTGNHIN